VRQGAQAARGAELGRQRRRVHGCHGRAGSGAVRGGYLLCEAQPLRTLRSPGNYREWIDAAKGGRPGGANVAVRTWEKLEWDGKNLKVTNVAAANDLPLRPYREGWTL